jgi:hypothetical protein
MTVACRTLAGSDFAGGDPHGDAFGEAQDSEPVNITHYLEGSTEDRKALKAAAHEALEDLGYEPEEVLVRIGS